MHQINVITIFHNVKFPFFRNAIKMYGEMSLQNHINVD